MITRWTPRLSKGLHALPSHALVTLVTLVTHWGEWPTKSTHLGHQDAFLPGLNQICPPDTPGGHGQPLGSSVIGQLDALGINLTSPGSNLGRLKILAHQLTLP